MDTEKKNHSYLKPIIALWFFLIILFSGSALLVYAIAKGKFGELPSFEELENPKSFIASEVYSADGILLGKYFVENRSNVHFNDISPNVINALVATEDVRFEEHSGIDLRGLFRVFIKTILLGQKRSGGGSTITQQLAKNLFPRKGFKTLSEKAITKLKEWITAVKLERNYTKNEIITMYLNTVDFGSNSYGIKSAASTYFNKAPTDLKVDEAAILIGLLKATTLYSPRINPEKSLKRRNIVMAQMNKYEFITDSLFDTLKAQPITLNFKRQDHNEGLAPYFREVLRDKLHGWCKQNFKPDGTPYDIYRDGLKIYTTLNSKMQNYAEKAVKEHLTDLQQVFYNHWKGQVPWNKHPEVVDIAVKRSYRYKMLKANGVSTDSIKRNFHTKIKMKVFTWKGERDTIMSPLDSIKYYKYFLQAGFMSMEPHTGYIRAWVGGNHHRYFKYDHVYRGKRQVGSAFKPFIYSLAIDNGYSPCQKIPNIPVTIKYDDREWTPKNSDPSYNGMMLSLKFGLANSINFITAYLMKQIGPQSVVQLARKMGIKSKIEPYPSICLGPFDISVYEMVGAYSTFANKGVWIEPIFLSRIEDKNGNVIEEFRPRNEDALSEQTAYAMTRMLRGVVDGVYEKEPDKKIGTGVRLRFKYNLRNPIAGKTGTTQNNSDGWFMGVTPELVSGVWVGCEDRSVHFRTTRLGGGHNMALPIWALYMNKVYADSSLNVYKGDFEKPKSPLTIELDCNKYQNQQKDYAEFGNEFN